MDLESGVICRCEDWSANNNVKVRVLPQNVYVNLRFMEIRKVLFDFLSKCERRKRLTVSIERMLSENYI